MSVYPEDPPRLAWGMWKRFLAATFAIVFLTAAGSATAVLLEVDNNLNSFLDENTPIAGVDEVLDDVDAGDPQTILVLGSDRRYADKAAGIPAVEFGPSGGGHHGPDEWVSVTSLARYREALAEFIATLPERLARPAQEGPGLRAVEGGLG